MTPEEAKAYLSLCPPEDETNPDVPMLAPAREQAMANPELAAWWEKEKSFDLLFSQKLTSLKPPPELQATIMRGGATIFFASRLIAETATEETEEEAEKPNLLSSPAAASLTEVGRSPRRDPVEEQESAVAKRWIWRMGFVMVGVVALLVLTFLFFFEYDIASKDLANKAHGRLTGELAKLERLAGEQETSAAPATEPGKTVAEMQKYLEDMHSPNPPELPGFVTRVAPGAVVTAAAESWNFYPVSHFTVQTGTTLGHLIILKADSLSQTEVPTEIIAKDLEHFREHIWSANGYIFIQLTSKEARP